jgi:hypothetical protein
MVQFFTLWLEKLKRKKTYEQELRRLIALNFFGELDGVYEVEVRKLDDAFVKRGLTRAEIEKIKKNLGPVRISG